MKLELTATAIIDTVNQQIPARIWEGFTDSGVPVKAWIVVISPQTLDAAQLAVFDAELREVPVERKLTSFDIRLAM